MTGMYNRLKADNQRILGGSDMKEIKITNPDGVELEGYARITDTTLQINPQGQAFNSRTYSIAVHIADFANLIEAGDTGEGWRAEFINSEGEKIIGSVKNNFLDRTFGYVSANLTEIKDIT